MSTKYQDGQMAFFLYNNSVVDGTIKEVIECKEYATLYHIAYLGGTISRREGDVFGTKLEALEKLLKNVESEIESHENEISGLRLHKAIIERQIEAERANEEEVSK